MPKEWKGLRGLIEESEETADKQKLKDAAAMGQRADKEGSFLILEKNVDRFVTGILGEEQEPEDKE